MAKKIVEKKVDEAKDAAAMALAKLDSLAADMPGNAVGGNRSPIWRLLHNEAGEWLSGPVLRAARARAKEILQARSVAIAERCLYQVEKTLGNASAYQAAGIYGLMRTHERIDAGEPTEHIAHLHRHEIDGLDSLAGKLARVLSEQQNQGVSDLKKLGDAETVQTDAVSS